MIVYSLKFNSENANTFEDFPITQLTLKGW